MQRTIPTKTEELMKLHHNDKEIVLLALYDCISFCQDKEYRWQLIREYDVIVDAINKEKKEDHYKHFAA